MKKALGTYEIAEICNVTPATIGHWIDKGILPTFSTGGGHRRVWAHDLVHFLKEHNIPIPAELQRGARLSALVVDDEDLVRQVVKRILQKLYPGMEIEEAVDGFEAGQKVSRLSPSLVILDLKLPGVNGLKVCKLLRSDPHLRHTKILTISGHNPIVSEQESLQAGADSFLAKPFDADDLRKKVIELLGGPDGDRSLSRGDGG